MKSEAKSVIISYLYGLSAKFKENNNNNNKKSNNPHKT